MLALVSINVEPAAANMAGPIYDLCSADMLQYYKVRALIVADTSRSGGRRQAAGVGERGGGQRGRPRCCVPRPKAPALLLPDAVRCSLARERHHCPSQGTILAYVTEPGSGVAGVFFDEVDHWVRLARPQS